MANELILEGGVWKFRTASTATDPGIDTITTVFASASVGGGPTAGLPALTFITSSDYTYDGAEGGNNPTGALTALSSAIAASTYWQVTTSSLDTSYPALMVQPATTGKSYSDMRIVFASGNGPNDALGPKTEYIADNSNNHTLYLHDPFIWIGIAPFAPTGSICSGSNGDWTEGTGTDPFAPEHKFSGWTPCMSLNGNSATTGGSLYIVESKETLWVYSHGSTYVYNDFFGAGALFSPFRNADGHSSGGDDPYRMYGLAGGRSHDNGNIGSFIQWENYNNPLGHNAGGGSTSARLWGNTASDRDGGFRMYAFVSSSIDGSTTGPDDAWRQIQLMINIDKGNPGFNLAADEPITGDHAFSFQNNDGEQEVVLWPLVYLDPSEGTSGRMLCYLRQMTFGPAAYGKSTITNSSGEIVAHIVSKYTDASAYAAGSVIMHNFKTLK